LKNKNYFEFLILTILGGLTSLSLPPYNYLFINFVTFSLFFIYIFQKKKSDSSKSKAFLYGWFFGFGYFLTNLYWISISLTFDANFKFLIPFALLLIPSFLAIFYGLVTYFFFRINNDKVIGNFFLFSLLFGVIEFLRGTILTGFPWNLIAYSFSSNLEIIQIISLIGTYAFNTLCVSFFVSPAILILKKNKKEIMVCIFFLLSPIILFKIGSSKIKSFESLNTIKNDYVIRALGSNIDLNRFYGNIDTVSVIDELIELSKPDLMTKTLFIWPEGIIPNINQSELKKYKHLFNKKFNNNHLLAVGINNIKTKNKEIFFYNSFSFYDHEINLVDTYNKVNLVPFGEFLPFEKILRGVGLKSLTNNYQPFSSGKKRELIKINKNNFDLNILPLICYEIIYSGKIYNNPEFDYIINISEDGWFGDSIGPHQHFTHSIFRAIESGKYLIRSANNGIAAVINPIGSVENKITLGNSGYIDFSEKRIVNRTLFSEHGNKIFLITILLYIFLIFSFNRIS
jgi:apolipoprotein N-acyltransferase